MIEFLLNGRKVEYRGDEKLSLLDFLRNEAGITSAKDGCSGQGACGACLVELNGKPTLACVTLMKKVAGGKVVTLEGLPDELRRTLGNAFVEKGAVQCGFCTPGFLMRTKILLQDNPRPSRPANTGGAEIEPVPLHRLRQDRRGHRTRRQGAGRRKRRRWPTPTRASAAARKNTRPGKRRPAAGPLSPTCASRAWFTAP